MESSTEPVNFGSSIIVPSVQELSKENIVKIPPRYVRTCDPALSDDNSSELPSVPVINLERFDDQFYRDNELEKLHSACREWGFFQVVNHGVSTLLLEEFKLEVESFFKLPYQEKKKLWQQPANHEGFGQLFVVSEEQKLDWSDMFYITTLPLHLRRGDLFEKLPLTLRKILEDYSKEVKRLAMTLLGHMATALKMDVKEMKDLFDDGVQSVRMNYYPQCPEPDRAVGFTSHSDADALTVLFQLNETEGLQIKKEGRWVSVMPRPNAFVVNVGDIMEIISNGIYRSIEHQATVNSKSERLSVATFYSSNLDSLLGPAPSLIDLHNPAIFRQASLTEYYKEFFARKLNGKSHLDYLRIVDVGSSFS